VNTDKAGQSMTSLRLMLERKLGKYPSDLLAFQYDEDHECFLVETKRSDDIMIIVRTTEDILRVVREVKGLLKGLLKDG
jgi:hypothetical protein